MKEEQVDPAILRALEAWRPLDAAPHWDDVLRRADVSRPRVVSSRTAALAALAGLAIVLLVPSFGIGSRLKNLLVGSNRPGLTLSTPLVQADGTRVGTFSLRSSGQIFVTVAGRRHRVIRPQFFSSRRPHPVIVTPFNWKLVLASSQTAVDARIQRTSGRPQIIARLCRPCSNSESGTLNLGRGAVAAVFAGEAVVLVDTKAGSARGVLRLDLPRRA